MKKNQSKNFNKQYNQALTLHQRGNILGAREIYTQLLNIDPSNADVLHHLGLTEYQLGKISEAVRLIEKALSISGKDPNCYSNLATCYSDLGDYDKAEELYRKALKKDPRLLTALSGLGTLLSRQGNYREASTVLASVVKKQPNHVAANINYALTLQKLNRHQDALPYAKKAAKIDPSNPAAQNSLGNIYLDLGDFEQASDYFRKSLNANPGFGSAFYNLARSKKFLPDDPDMQYVEQSEQLVNDSNLDTENQISFNFGLGKIYDDLRDWDRAFGHIKRANTLIAAPYNRNQISDNLSNIMTHFSKDWMQAHANCGLTSKKPIFIVGMPRSGTTLVEQILASHADVCSVGESQAIPDVANLMSSELESSKAYPFCIDLLNSENTARLAEKYIEISNEKSHCDPEKIQIDKMTTNYMHLGLILTLFPNARIVHCVRNPLDVGLSCYFQNFNDRPGFACDLNNIAHFYSEYQRIVRHWMNLFPDSIHEIKYSDLVNDSRPTIESLLNFCHLSLDENCFQHHKINRQVTTASNWQVKQPLYKDSLERWKNYEKHLAPLMQLLSDDNVHSGPLQAEAMPDETHSPDKSGSTSFLKKLFSR